MHEVLSKTPLSRRSFVKVAGAAALSVSAVAFAGCGKEEAAPEPEPEPEMTKEEKYEALAVLALAQALTTYFPTSESANSFVLESTGYKVTTITSESCPYYDDLAVFIGDIDTDSMQIANFAKAYNHNTISGTSVYGKFALYDKYGDVVKRVRYDWNKDGKGDVYLDATSSNTFHCFFPDTGQHNAETGWSYIEMLGYVFPVKVSL